MHVLVDNLYVEFFYNFVFDTRGYVYLMDNRVEIVKMDG